MAKANRKCGPCTPAKVLREQFTAAQQGAKASGNCETMFEVLKKLKPAIQLEADQNPKRRALLFREVLAKQVTADRVCSKIKSSASYWAGFEGLGSTRRRVKRRRR